MVHATCDGLKSVVRTKVSKSASGKVPDAVGPSCRTKATRVMSHKRRKKSNVPMGSMHPSVKLAQGWTSRGEQVEEIRAQFMLCYSLKQEIQPSTPTGEPSNQGGDRRQTEEVAGIVDDVAPANVKRSSRPWEWSTKDCEDVLAGAIGLFSQDIMDDITLSCELDHDVVVGDDHAAMSPGTPSAAPGSGGSPSAPTSAGGAVVSQAESMRRKPKRSSRREPESVETPPASLSEKETDGKNEASVTVSRLDEPEREEHQEPQIQEPPTPPTPPTPQQPQQRKSLPRKRVKPSNSSRREVQQARRRRHSAPPKARVTVTSDDIIKEDERKARELNAELNRNPRRVTSQGAGAPASLDRRLAKGQWCGDERVGDCSGEGGLQSGLGNDGGAACESGSQRCRGGIDKWPFFVGASLEVWWEDAWYRCTMSSVSTTDKLGILEFLPYRRKGRAWGREYSTELDVSEWVDAGNFAEPGTHLKWD